MKSYVGSTDSVRGCWGLGKGMANKKLCTHMWGREWFSLGASGRHFFPADHFRCLGNCTPVYIWRRISFQLNTVRWDCQTRGCVPSAVPAEPISLSPGTLKPEDSEGLAQTRFSSSPSRCSMTCSILFISREDLASELPLHSAGHLTHGQ